MAISCERAVRVVSIILLSCSGRLLLLLSNTSINTHTHTHTTLMPLGQVCFNYVFPPQNRAWLPQQSKLDYSFLDGGMEVEDSRE